MLAGSMAGQSGRGVRFSHLDCYGYLLTKLIFSITSVLQVDICWSASGRAHFLDYVWITGGQAGPRLTKLISFTY